MQLKSRFNPVLLGSAMVAGALTSLGTLVRPAHADFTTAYCDGNNYATNIHYPGDPEGGEPLTMRIYYRPDEVVFLNTEARREPNPEGYNYSNMRGEDQWELFIPNGSSTCTLSRNGRLVDSGTTTMREPPTSGD
jgi:hypothetical protein